MLSRSILLSIFVTACASSAQEIHLERIERRVGSSRDAEPEAGAVFDERASTLQRSRLVRAVLAANPSLEAARASVREAVARYQAEDTLPDPVLSYTFAPGSIVDPNVRYGQVIQLSQRFPWADKLSREADAALYRAEMAAEDYAKARLELALRACRLHDRYYAIARALEVNEAQNGLIVQLRRGIDAQYAAGQGTLHEPIQAEVMLVHVEHEHHLLERRQTVVVAQLNALLHRPPDASMPPPPEVLDPPLKEPPSAEALTKRALASRPELRALDAEQKGLEASIDVAQLEYAPDFTVSGSYNSMWAEPAHQLMVGLSANLPLQVARRRGGESAARARLSGSEHRLEALADDIAAEVHAARARVVEAIHVVRLYREQLLPLATKQVDAARSAFESGKASFSDVIAAQRELWTAERQWHEAFAELYTRQAELERAVGQVPGLSPGGDR